VVTPDSPLHLESILQLLDRLRGTVETFAAREATLEREHNLQLHREREGWEAATQRHQEILEGRLAAATERHAGQREAFETRSRSRRDWIDRAHRASRNRVARTLAEQEGHRVYQLQMAMIQQKKDLAATREQLHQRHAAYQAELTQERESLAKLRKAAARALRGYPVFARALIPPPPGGREPAGDLDLLIVRAREQRGAAAEILREFRRLGIPKLFAALPASLMAMLVVLAAAGAAFGLPAAGLATISAQMIGGGLLVVGLIAVFGLLGVGKSQAAPLAQSLTAALAQSREAQEAALRLAETDLHTTLARLEERIENSSATFDQQRRHSPELSQSERAARQQRLDEQASRLLAHHDAVHHRRQSDLIAGQESELAALRDEADTVITQIHADHDATLSKLLQGYDFNWTALEEGWQAAIQPVYEDIAALLSHADSLFPEWTREMLDQWKAPADFANAARLGSLNVDVSALAKARPQSPRLALPGPDRFGLPVSLVMPQRGSVLFESDGGGRAEMIASLNQLILRLLSVAPPAKLSFTIIDPVGLGEGFSGLMHLADYDESLINSRIWTQSQQIEARLGDLNDHIEKVIQMYLRNEFPNHHGIQPPGREDREKSTTSSSSPISPPTSANWPPSACSASRTAAPAAACTC
jgi:DNA segregation ATPase FtsK/SpoIIIE, S-DNA-T family